MLRIASRRNEWRSPQPLGVKLAAWRLGFTAESAALYGFPAADPGDYLPDYASKYRCRNINPVPEITWNKLFLRMLLLQRGIPQAETICYGAGADLLLLPLDKDRSRYVSTDELEQWMIEDGGSYVVKPQAGSRGRSIYLVEPSEGILVRRRGREVHPFRAADLSGLVLVERRLVQGDFWRALAPVSTNTIRAVTMWANGDKTPFLGCAVQRFGTADTAPTDNWSGGGICARVDLESGRLGAGRMHPRKGALSQAEFTHHPDTGVAIEGAVVPHWDRIRETVLAAAASLPVLRYVGWDVMVDHAGTPVIIEGNHNTDVDLLQVHGGLLADPRVRRFYERCGVI